MAEFLKQFYWYRLLVSTFSRENIAWVKLRGCESRGWIRCVIEYRSGDVYRLTCSDKETGEPRSFYSNYRAITDLELYL